MDTTSAAGTGRGSGVRVRRHWQVAVWPLLSAAALVVPGPSWIAALLILGAGAAALVAEHLVVATLARLALAAVAAGCGFTAMVLVPLNGFGWVPVYASVVTAARLVPRRGVVAVFALVVAAGFALAVAWLAQSPWAALAGIGVPFVALRVWDREALRREHERVLALLDELEARRETEVRAAAAEERARIARDLHDVLAHTLSGLSLHLQAVRAVVARTPEPDPTVVSTLDRAAELARGGLDEAREAVTALRDAPAPDEDALTAVVAGHPRAELVVEGEFAALPSRLRETAFATVRESLTNAARHAPGAAVTVAVDARDGLAVRVEDDGAATVGPGRGGGAPAPGGGNGLRGLAERAAGAGGTFEAAPSARGWCVLLRVPTTVGMTDGALAAGPGVSR